MSKTFTQMLSDYIVKVQFENLQHEVVKKTGLLVLDFLGAAAVGSNSPSAGMLQRALVAELIPGLCWVVGPEDKRVSPLMAALCNGFNAHTLEYDDTHRNSLFHPGAPTMPAALATAQLVEANGKKLIEGLVAGYEVGIRLAESINPSHYAFWHTTATVGCFAAAAAAGKIMGLTVEQLVWALGNAGTQAAGLWEFQTDGALTKPLHPGKAALAGVLSALLAREGFTGTSTILEGKRGFCKATARIFDLSRLIPQSQDPPRILEVTFKNDPSCGHTHTPIDAALQLFPKVREAGENITRIRVITNQAAIRIAGNKKPETGHEAKFSIPYCVAYTLRYGRLELSSFAPEALEDPQVRSLMARVEMEVGEEMEKIFQQKRPTELFIELQNGQTLSCRVEYRRGDPENPPSEEEVKAKFRMFVTPVLTPSQIKGWEDACDRLRDWGNMKLFPYSK